MLTKKLTLLEKNLPTHFHKNLVLYTILLHTNLEIQSALVENQSSHLSLRFSNPTRFLSVVRYVSLLPLCLVYKNHVIFVTVHLRIMEKVPNRESQIPLSLRFLTQKTIYLLHCIRRFYLK